MPGKKSEAFTLIELLIVVAIIAILAAIAVPNFLEAQTRAKVSKALANMRTLAVGLEAFRTDHHTYPPSWSGSNNYPNYVQNRMDPLWSPRNAPAGFPKASLTTPIPYVSSFVGDPFMEAGAYHDSQGVFEDYAWQYGVDRDAAEAWVLESYGPNRKPDQPSAGGAAPDKPNPNLFLTLYETVGRMQTRAYFFTGDWAKKFDGAYDPTNGTVSEGDIVRMSYATQ